MVSIDLNALFAGQLDDASAQHPLTPGTQTPNANVFADLLARAQLGLAEGSNENAALGSPAPQSGSLNFAPGSGSIELPTPVVAPFVPLPPSEKADPGALAGASSGEARGLETILVDTGQELTAPGGLDVQLVAENRGQVPPALVQAGPAIAPASESSSSPTSPNPGPSAQPFDTVQVDGALQQTFRAPAPRTLSSVPTQIIGSSAINAKPIGGQAAPIPRPIVSNPPSVGQQIAPQTPATTQTPPTAPHGDAGLPAANAGPSISLTSTGAPIQPLPGGQSAPPTDPVVQPLPTRIPQPNGGFESPQLPVKPGSSNDTSQPTTPEAVEVIEAGSSGSDPKKVARPPVAARPDTPFSRPDLPTSADRPALTPAPAKAPVLGTVSEQPATTLGPATARPDLGRSVQPGQPIESDLASGVQTGARSEPVTPVRPTLVSEPAIVPTKSEIPNTPSTADEIALRPEISTAASVNGAPLVRTAAGKGQLVKSTESGPVAAAPVKGEPVRVIDGFEPVRAVPVQQPATPSSVDAPRPASFQPAPEASGFALQDGSGLEGFSLRSTSEPRVATESAGPSPTQASNPEISLDRATIARSVTAPASTHATKSTSASHQAIRTQVIEQIAARLEQAAPGRSVSIALEPAELGRVVVHFGKRDQELSVRLAVDNDDVAAMLARDLPRLESALSKTGELVKVEIATPDANVGSEQGQGRSDARGNQSSESRRHAADQRETSSEQEHRRPGPQPRHNGRIDVLT